MSNIVNTKSLAILDHVFKAVALAKPATVYLALWADDAEVSTTATGYARLAIPGDTTLDWPVCSPTGEPTKKNGKALTFPKAINPWGNVTNWRIMTHATESSDALTLFLGLLTTPKYIAKDDILRIPAGGISITLPNVSEVNGFTAGTKRSVLNHLLGGLTYTPPSATFVSLGTGLNTTTDPVSMDEWGDPQAGRKLFEPNNYSTGIANTAIIEMCPNAAADVTLTHVGIYDAETGGNLLCYAKLPANLTVLTSDRVSYPANNCFIILY